MLILSFILLQYAVHEQNKLFLGISIVGIIGLFMLIIDEQNKLRIEGFNTNATFICCKNTIVEKDSGLILEGNYFIKEDRIFEINTCKILKD